MREVLGSIPRAALCPQLCRCWQPLTSFGSQFGAGAEHGSAIINLEFSPEARGRVENQWSVATAHPHASESTDKLCFGGCSISGLVVEYIVAIDVTRVRFPADALFRYPFYAPNSDLGLRRAPLCTTPNGGL